MSTCPRTVDRQAAPRASPRQRECPSLCGGDRVLGDPSAIKVVRQHLCPDEGTATLMQTAVHRHTATKSAARRTAGSGLVRAARAAAPSIRAKAWRRWPPNNMRLTRLRQGLARHKHSCRAGSPVPLLPSPAQRRVGLCRRARGQCSQRELAAKGSRGISNQPLR